MKDLRQSQFVEISTTAADNNCSGVSLYSSIQSWHFDLSWQKEYQFPSAVCEKERIFPHESVFLFPFKFLAIKNSK